jgi:hypothetical protein
MTTITARLHFRFPFDLTSEYLREGLGEVSKTGPHRMQLTARLPATTLELSKNVVVECVPDPDESERKWRIHWTPEPGGIYPSFDGNLSAYADERDGTTILELSGNYRPPLGAAGAAFDHVVGQKITADTAHDVLANLAAEMKTRYAFEEAREVFQKMREESDESPARE